MWGPHLIKLPEGALPDYIALTPYQMFCWRTMGKAVKLRSKPNPKLEQQLLQAHMRMRPEEYVAYIWMSTLLVFVIALAGAALFGGVLLALLHVQPALVLMFFVLLSDRAPPDDLHGPDRPYRARRPRPVPGTSTSASARP